MNATQEILYSVDARIYTRPQDAAKEFARNYWPQPRKIHWNPETRSFQMVGGAGRVYQVELIDGRLIRGCDGTQLFVITVKQTA